MRRATLFIATVALISVMTALTFASAASSAPKSGAVLSDYRLDFGECAVGDVCHATLTVTNDTSDELVFDGVPQYAGQFGPEGRFCVGFLDSPARLEAGGSCTDFLVFTPLDQKHYKGEACYAFADLKHGTVCAKLSGRGR